MKDPILVLNKLPFDFYHVIAEGFGETHSFFTGETVDYSRGPVEQVFKLNAPQRRDNHVDELWLDMLNTCGRPEEQGFPKKTRVDTEVRWRLEDEIATREERRRPRSQPDLWRNPVRDRLR